MSLSAVCSWRRVIRRFWPYLRPDRGRVALAVLGILGLAATNTMLVWLIGMPFDRIQGGDFAPIPGLLVALALLVIINQGFHLLATISSSWLGLRFVGRVRQAMVQQTLRVSFPGLVGQSRGDWLARLSADVDRVQQVWVEMPLFLTSHLAILLCYGVMLFWIDGRLALIAMLFVPLFFAFQQLFARKRQRASHAFFATNGNLLSYEEQALANLHIISSYTAEARIATAHAVNFEQARQSAMRLRWLEAMSQGGVNVLVYAVALVVVLVGIDALERGELALGALVSFMIYLGYLSVPIRGLAQVPAQWQGNLGAVSRVVEALELSPVVIEYPRAKPLLNARGEIELQHVTFAFDDQRPVLRDVSLTIPAGQSVALVGPTGAGKSTLFRLVQRFYDPQQGAIKLDGVDLRDITLESLRTQVCAVWQDASMLDDTVRANLLLACPYADDNAIQDVLAAAQAQEFVAQLPQGIDTVIGAQGVQLSGGQRQRLALAQALLRDAPVLLLDEVTSALDGVTEESVVRMLERRRHGRTTIVIAHRYASIRAIERVIYFTGDGSVLAGSHDELYRSNAHYRRAVAWQLG